MQAISKEITKKIKADTILSVQLINPFFQKAGFSGDSDCKEYACNAGDPGSIPGSGRSPQEGNGNPLQYSCLDNSMATVHGITKSQTLLSE